VLEILQRPGGARPEDPVDAPRIEADPGERRLQFGDVIAAQVRSDQHQQAITEVPRCLDDRAPGLLVASSARPQAPLLLELADRAFGGRAKKTRLGAGWREAGGAETALQVAYGLAALTRSQWEAARNSSSS
jgi:hypothetical protein